MPLTSPIKSLKATKAIFNSSPCRRQSPAGAFHQSGVGERISATVEGMAKVAPPHSGQSRRRESTSLSVPRRIVTRSQSRELGAALSDDDVEPVSDAQRKKKKRARTEDHHHLATVREESGPNSGDRQLEAQLQDVESEAEHDFSGTTFLPTDSELEAADLDLDPLKMLDALPRLHDTATSVLDFLISSLPSPADILETAKRLQDPKDSHSKQLERLLSSFDSEAKYFGYDTYIDVARISNAFPSVDIPSRFDGSQARPWKVSGVLYQANCARFAIEMFSAANRKISSQSPLYGLEGTFPSPFLSTLVSDATNSNDAGESSLRRATFDLALDIRTNLLKLNLEMRKGDQSCDPHGLLNYMFFNEKLKGQGCTSDLRLRGFNISAFRDSDGNLPSRFEEDARDRIYEIRRFFLNNTNVPVDLGQLEIAFPWSELLLNAVKWLRVREQEINRILCQQPSIKNVYGLLEREVNLRSGLSGASHAPAPIEVHHTDVIASSSNKLATPYKTHRPLFRVAEKGKHGGSPSRLLLNSAGISHLARRERGPPEARSSQKQQWSQKPQHAVKEASFGSCKQSPSRSSMKAQQASSSERAVAVSADLEEGIVSSESDFVCVCDSCEIRNESNEDRPSHTGITTDQPASRGAYANTAGGGPSVNFQSPSPKEVLDAIARHKVALKMLSGRPGFIDRQANAVRISPISESSLARRGFSDSREQKRAVIPESQSEDDSDFTRDRRSIDVRGKRAQKPSRPQRPDHSVDLLSDDEPRLQLHNELISSPARPGQVRSPSPSLPSRPSVAPRASRPMVRSVTILSNRQVSAPPLPQVRRRWTNNENRQLIYLVGEYGPSWSRIKREDDLWPEADGGPQLTQRDQVQLKDRARNIVMEHYKSGQRPPPNFDLVNIKHTDREKLKKMGIEVPDPREIWRLED